MGGSQITKKLNNIVCFLFKNMEKSVIHFEKIFKINKIHLVHKVTRKFTSTELLLSGCKDQRPRSLRVMEI